MSFTTRETSSGNDDTVEMEARNSVETPVTINEENQKPYNEEDQKEKNLSDEDEYADNVQAQPNKRNFSRRVLSNGSAGSWVLNRQEAFRRISINIAPPQIPTNDDESKLVVDKHGSDSWQLRALHFIHSKPVQATLIILLLLDVAVLFAEMYLAAEYPACHIIQRDAISCCPKSSDYDDYHNDDGHLRFLAGGGGGPICSDPNTYKTSYQAGCDSNNPSLHTAHVALFGITIGILCCFMMELSTLIICLSPCIFFSYFFYIIDFIVVFASFALEIAFHVMSKDNIGAAVGMLVVIRLWRFARIGHGLVKAAVEAQNVKHKKVLKKYEALMSEYDVPFESRLEDSAMSRRKASLNNAL